MLLGSIPSPSDGNLGPFHMYGIILAVGVLVGVYVAEQRWRRRGYPKDGIYDIAFWVVIWGVIGARLYHVITDYQLFEDDPLRAFQIWRGGLVDLGRGDRRRDRGDRDHLPAQAPDARRHGLHAVRASCSRRRSAGGATTSTRSCSGSRRRCRGRSRSRRSTDLLGYAQYTTFQPTFLYESLACLAIFGILLLVEHRARLKLGQTFALYVVLYTFARFFFENMRIDPAHEIAGLRLNAWVSIVVFLFGIGWFVWLGRHEPEQRHPGDAPTSPRQPPPSRPDGVS